MKDRDTCWVEFIDEGEARGRLADAYAHVAGKNGRVHNLYRAMSLSAPAIAPADDLYRALLHDADCPLEPWLRELVSTQVAVICDCTYAAVNHGENFHDFYGDRAKSEAILEAIGRNHLDSAEIDDRLRQILRFNDKLARRPETVSHDDVEMLRHAGLNDKEIVYIVQISASFAYWARVINGLGIGLADEPIGLAAKPAGG